MAEAQGVARAADEQVALDQPRARALDLGGAEAGGERMHRGGGERVARHGAEGERRALRGVEPVEPRGQQRVQRGGQLRRGPPLADVGEELLEEQRVPARRGRDPPLLLGGQAAAAERGEQRVAGRGRQRRQRDDGPALEPAAGALDQVGARDPDHEHRGAAQAGHEVEQHVEQRRLRPVGVIDHERERRLPGEAADELLQRPVGVLAGLAALQADRGGHAPHGDRGDPQLGGELVGAALAAHLLDDLAQRPQRDPFAVLAAAAGAHGALQLRDEARLADARLAEDREQLRRAPLGDARERLAQRAQLLVAPDQRLVEAARDGRRVGVEPAEQQPAALERRGAGGVPHDLPGRLREPDLAALRRPREPLRDGDRLADHRRARGGDHLAGAGAGADAERQLVAQLGGRAQRALGIVLVRHRHAEHGDHGVAAQLDDAAAVAGEHRAAGVVEALDDGAQRLGVAAGLRAGELGDHAGHEAPRVGRARGAGRQRHRLGHVLAQDRRLERAQVRRRLDAEPFDERAVRVAVGGERVGLAAGAVERQHQLAAQALPQRMCLDQRLELPGDLGVAADREIGLDALAEAADPQILQPRDLGLREALVGDVGERRPAPQLERRAERRRGVPRHAARQLLAPAPQLRLEAVGVERARCEPHGVAAALGAHELLADRRPQPRHHDLDRVAGVLRRLRLPELVEHAVEGHGVAAVHDQQREQRQRAAARDAGSPAAVEVDLDRTEDPELRVHRGASLSGV